MNLENDVLKEKVNPETPMKEWMINYVGRSYGEEVDRAEKETGKSLEWDGSVTVEMMTEIMIKEFPEFIMAMAEENFIRGYRQAMEDLGIKVTSTPCEECDDKEIVQIVKTNPPKNNPDG